jgi:hypothetical protein
MIKELSNKNIGNIKIYKMDVPGSGILLLEKVFNFGSYNCEYTAVPHLMEHLICEAGI